jgi:parallel beta-helix repeat protein
MTRFSQHRASAHAAALAAALLATAAAQANPFDPGTPGYKKKHIYVDSAFSCKLPASCGTQTNPYKNLAEAMRAAGPGDEVIIAGHDNRPYYLEDDGIAPATIRAWPTLMDLNRLGRDPTQPRLLIRNWLGTPKPIIRGTIALNGWTPVAGQSNLYSHSWAVQDDTGTRVLEPQQVYRNSLPAGQQSLRQIGGKVFGGYNRDTYEASKTDASIQISPLLTVALNGTLTDLWPGYTPFDKTKGLSQLAPNQFYFDTATNTLYAKLDKPLASTERLEVSVRHFLLDAQGLPDPVTGVPMGIANVTLQNLVFERSNTSYYWRGGAVLLNGTGLIVDGVDFRDTDAGCLSVGGADNIVRNSSFTRCGQVGLGGNGQGHIFRNNYFTANNSRNFSADWEAGPTKFIGGPGGIGLDDSEFSNNVLVANNGNGIWLDTGNDRNVIRDNVVAFNHIGIYLEDSGENVIDRNVVFGNANQAVNLRGGRNSVISNNLFVGNGGDGVYMAPKAGANPLYESTNVKVTGNTMAWHDEAANKKPVWVTRSTVLSGNRYCGTQISATLDPSLHFWLQDWARDPNQSWANNVYSWPTWQAPKTSPVNAPITVGFDTNSTMQLANLPDRVAGWLRAPEWSLIHYPLGASATRAEVQAIVDQFCK